MRETITYPFSAIVALEDLKLGLILNAINPKIGGLLILGPKGSGKTTAVRALADVLPNIKIVEGCPFNCNPDDPSNMCEKCRTIYSKGDKLPFEERKMWVIDLPLGATEDRVVGSLDVEKAIKTGVEALEPGVMAQANQNVLYVDEVNLLPDHIADDLLDAAATGWNVVEREGISVKHPSRFILIGTMNPEEGQLRPQLLDRFPLSVEVSRVVDVGDRVEVVKRNINFDSDPEGFVKKHSVNQEELKNRIIQARKILSNIEISGKLVELVCKTCLDLKVDGMRPDIVITKTAQTLAAFENQSSVTFEHILKAAELSLRHRTREGGFLEPATSQEINEALKNNFKEMGSSEDKENRTDRFGGGKDKGQTYSRKEGRKVIFPFGRRRIGNKEKAMLKAKSRQNSASENVLFGDKSALKGNSLFDSKPEKGGSDAVLTTGTKWSTPNLTTGSVLLTGMQRNLLPSFKFAFKGKKLSRHLARSVGKRAEAVSAVHRGRARGWKISDGKPSDIHLSATIRAAAVMQTFREKSPDMAVTILPEDVREKQRIYRAPMTIIFVLDLSESMLKNIDDVKEAMLRLHSDAYRFRDRVGIVALKEMGAVVVQHPTNNLKLVTNKLLRLRLSGFTPLAAGMLKALEVLKEAKRRDASTIPVMAIITDGETNIPLKRNVKSGEIRELDAVDAAFFKYEAEAVEDVASISEIVKKEGIRTVVIDTSVAPTDLSSTSGFSTTKMIASITNGIYYRVSRSLMGHGEEHVEEISEAILQAQRHISHTNYLTQRLRAT